MWREDNDKDTSGTPGYMAPEVMCRQRHTVSVDYFAVGVMAYECMNGRVRKQLVILMFSGHMWGNQGRRFVTIFSRSKSRSESTRFQKAGAQLPPTL